MTDSVHIYMRAHIMLSERRKGKVCESVERLKGCVLGLNKRFGFFFILSLCQNYNV